MSEEEIRSSVIQVALELTTEQEPSGNMLHQIICRKIIWWSKINRNKK